MSANYSHHKNKFLSTRQEDHAGNFPIFKQPSVQGYFSVDGCRKYHPNLSQIKYLHLPKDLGHVSFNLNHGIEEGVKKDESKSEKLDIILQWAHQNQHKIEDTKTHLGTDFFCFRGLLTLLMCTPYEQKENWIICATKWNGTIYLCAFDTEEKRRNRESASAFQKRCMAWGYKFEQFMSKGTLDSLPNTKKPVNECEELCVTFRTRLSGHSIIFGAEMDGVRGNREVTDLDELSQAVFVELKTSRHIQSDKQNFSFLRYKLLKWWCQSFLVGIKEVICGFRDDSGTVHELQEFPVKDMPKMARGYWDPCVCMNFCGSFLSLAKSVVIETDPADVWRFERRPGSDRVTWAHVRGPSEFTFLPSWYTHKMPDSR